MFDVFTTVGITLIPLIMFFFIWDLDRRLNTLREVVDNILHREKNFIALVEAQKGVIDDLYRAKEEHEKRLNLLTKEIERRWLISSPPEE